MEARELRYFAEVVDLGSMTRAASSLNISQPALSKSIRLLEERLGCTLLERGRFGVRPTIFGETLYVRAKAVNAELQRARNELDELTGGRPAQLSVGILPSQAMGPISDATVQMVCAQPNLRIQMIERPRVDLVPSLRRGEFEIAIATLDRNAHEPGLAQRVLFYDRPVLSVRRDHPLLNANPIWIGDLLEYPWILPRPGADHRIHIENYFRTQGYTLPEEIIESQSVPFTRAVIMKSDFIGILPNDTPSAEERAGFIVGLDIGTEIPDRAIGIIYRSDHPLPQAANTFIQEILKTCHRMGLGKSPTTPVRLDHERVRIEA